MQFVGVKSYYNGTWCPQCLVVIAERYNSSHELLEINVHRLLQTVQQHFKFVSSSYST